MPDRHPCPHYGRVRDRAVRADVRRVGGSALQDISSVPVKGGTRLCK